MTHHHSRSRQGNGYRIAMRDQPRGVDSQKSLENVKEQNGESRTSARCPVYVCRAYVAAPHGAYVFSQAETDKPVSER